MKKKLFIAFCILLSTAIISFAGAFLWFRSQLQPPTTQLTKKQILITKGSSAEKIAKILKDGGVIKNELAFRLYVKIYSLAGSLPPGQFSIAQNLSVQQVLEVLKKGPNEVWVTIPEGLRREQLPDRFISALNLVGAPAQDFKDKFLALSKNSEGYLFPETYLIPIDIIPSKAVMIMEDTFNKKFGNSFSGDKRELYNVLILASLLERETRNASEMADVAGVLKNRMTVGMPLQVDATVQYAKANLLCGKAQSCSDWWPTVYLEDYKIESPFNTYLISGLPSSPISSPGLSSLKAAQNPSSHEYFYYIHDRTGQIHFAKTLPEHNANVQKYLR